MASSPRICPAARRDRSVSCRRFVGDKAISRGFIVSQPVSPIEKLHAQEQSFINYSRLQSPQIHRHLAIE